jgi:hypothetical protein
MSATAPLIDRGPRNTCNGIAFLLSWKMTIKGSSPVVASRQHDPDKIAHETEPALAFCVSPAVMFLLLSDRSEEMFKQEWMNVPDAVGFAFALKGLMVLERTDCFGIRHFNNS